MNIGFLGCSKIGEKVIEALNIIPDAKLYECSARSKDKALAYQKKHGFLKSYDSYEDMCKDENIDLVYVSTMISPHYKDALLALKYNKPCIVEKAFTLNAKEAEELCYYSEKHNVYLTEAIRTRYMPSKNIIKNLLNEGIIGDVYHIEANLSYPIKSVPRLVDKSLGGGILLDVGVYPINFVTMLFGYDFDILNSILIINKEHQVDESMVVNFYYKSGITASLYSSMNGLTSKKGIIYGSKGFIEVDNINNPLSIKVYGSDEKRNPIIVKEIQIKEQANGYECEFIEAINNIKNRQIESDSMYHIDSIKIMRIIDEIFKKSIKVEN